MNKHHLFSDGFPFVVSVSYKSVLKLNWLLILPTSFYFSVLDFEFFVVLRKIRKPIRATNIGISILAKNCSCVLINWFHAKYQSNSVMEMATANEIIRISGRFFKMRTLNFSFSGTIEWKLSLRLFKIYAYSVFEFKLNLIYNL